MRGGWQRAVVWTAVLVLLGGCALPNCSPKVTTQTSATTPTPSPSPTPTAPLQASTPPFHAGEVGVAYTPVMLAATGGVQPYTWTITTGALPDGLTLGSDGSVSGTPTKAGGFSFSVQLADAGGSATALPSTIAIAAAPVASLVNACARYCSVEVGCADVCGNFGTLTGGTAPFTYALQPGGLVPVGTHLSQLSLAGTFAQRAQFWQFRVVVTDALGQTTSITPTFYVYPHIFLASGSCTYRLTCSVKLGYSGGTPGASPTVRVTGWAPVCSLAAANVCPPQPTFSATAQGGVVSINLTNAPNFPATQGLLTLSIVDKSPCSSDALCSAGATLTLI